MPCAFYGNYHFYENLFHETGLDLHWWGFVLSETGGCFGIGPPNELEGCQYEIGNAEGRNAPGAVPECP